jgi:uncharacterized phiE125 gp8 family phage protein
MSYRSFKVTTEPTSLPVSQSVIKAHLRVSHSDDDSLIESLQFASQDTIQRLTRRSLMLQTITLKLDKFPSDAIELPRPPAVSVTSIQYVDEDGATQTWASANYDVDVSSYPARITPAYNSGTLQTFPDVRLDTPNSVTVVYTCGESSSGDLPDGLVLAHKMLVGHFYENREATGFNNIGELPLGINMLLASQELSEVF